MEYFKEEKYNSEGELLIRAYYQLENSKMIDYCMDFDYGLFSQPDHWVDDSIREIKNIDSDIENITKTNNGYIQEVEGEELAENWQAAKANGVNPHLKILERNYYNSKKQLVKYQKFIRYGTSDALWVEIEYKYDEYGNILFYREFDESMEINNNWNYEYKRYNLKNGQQVTLLESKNQNNYSLVDFGYNEYGDKISEITKFLDEDKNIVSFINKVYEYRYDENGRWLEKNVYKNQKFKTKYTRKYGDFSKQFT